MNSLANFCSIFLIYFLTLPINNILSPPRDFWGTSFTVKLFKIYSSEKLCIQRGHLYSSSKIPISCKYMQTKKNADLSISYITLFKTTDKFFISFKKKSLRIVMYKAPSFLWQPPFSVIWDFCQYKSSIRESLSNIFAQNWRRLIRSQIYTIWQIVSPTVDNWAGRKIIFHLLPFAKWFWIH